MDVQRAILLFALAFVLIVLYQRWLEFQMPDTPPAAQTASGEATAPGDPDIPDTPDAAGVPGAPGAVGEAPQVPEEEGGAEVSGPHIQVTTDLMRLAINPTGGTIEELALLKHPVSVNRPDEPFLLMKQVQTEKGPDIFTTQSGLIGKDREYPNHKTPYEAGRAEYRIGGDSDVLTVDLDWTAPDQVRYTKRFTFTRDSYDIKIDYLVDNRSATPWTGFIYGQFLRTHIVPDRGFILGAVPTYLGGAIYTHEDKFEKIDFDEMHKTPLKRTVSDGWVAMLQHYFVGAWFPRDDAPYSFYSRVLNNPVNTRYNIGLNSLTPVTVAPGETGQLGLDLFAGPKEQERLAEKPQGFDLTVDYGWLTPVSAPLFWVLDKIHGAVGNWGWAIILLTCLIKLAFYPLSATSYKSMAKMKKLQPRLQTLKDRYGDDKAKMNQAMMEIYKKEKVNPLGGCLPIVIQIPVFIALYWVLLESVELRQAPWELWINDLSIKDPYYVLPILMGASMVAQQLLNPSPLDPMQKRIMMALPVVFTFLFLYFPAGLVLYWLVNNVLSIAQQWYINKNVVG
jgi:YidC/Oxa1 family membrane protein insertase